jgi:hypothetical protein
MTRWQPGGRLLAAGQLPRAVVQRAPTEMPQPGSAPQLAQGGPGTRIGADSLLGTVTLNLASSSAGKGVRPGDTIPWSVSAVVSQGDNAGLATLSVDFVQDAANASSKR